MSLTLTDLKLYGSASMPDDNTPTNIGGAIAFTKKVDFSDINGSVQIVSSSGSDTTQTVQLFYRDITGSLLNETRTLNGLTPVLFSAAAERILKGLKSATTNGAVALEAQTATRTGTAQAGTINSITFDAGACAWDGAYNGMIVRLTGGTGANQINEVIDYNGTTKVAIVQDYWHGSVPDATTTFRISQGFFYDKLPNEILEVRRPWYNSAANAPGGGAVAFHDKVFFMNSSNANALLNALVTKFADATARVTFGLESIVNGTGSNGAGNNRTVAPAGVAFNSTTSPSFPGTNLLAGSYIGCWLKLSLADGDIALKAVLTMQMTGSST